MGTERLNFMHIQVIYPSQAMTVAYGTSVKEAGLDGNIASVPVSKRSQQSNIYRFAGSLSKAPFMRGLLHFWARVTAGRLGSDALWPVCDMS